MNIIYTDENDKLTPEMWSLIEQAADAAIDREFGEELAALGIKTKDVCAEVGVTIVEADEIRDLNRDYRGNDKVTDVLSFPQYASREELFEELASDEEDADILVGDVVICYEQAERQAEEYGTGITREVVYLFVHSIFHLFGYDHEDEEERREMRAREKGVLSKIGI